MREELLAERAGLKMQIEMCIPYLMSEMDKEKTQKILSIIKDRSLRIEQINCKLAHDEFRNLFKRTET